MPTVEQPVLIIGAGVAGLALAQGLRLRSIPFRIFERRAKSHVRQGHRFRISREGQDALKSVLSPQLQSLLRRTAPEGQDFAPRYIDARKLDFGEPQPVDPTNSMPLDRTWLRMLLSVELQDVITYEKQFESYEIEGGVVQARFTDGSVSYGQLLVGADGIRSFVRERLQPDRRLLDLERWIMWGRTPMMQDLRETLTMDTPDILSWCMCLDHDNNVQTVIEPVVWPNSVYRESEGALPDFADYIYWAICTAPLQYAQHLPTTIQEKRLYLAQLSETWHPTLRHLLASATHELSACVSVLSSQPDIQIHRRADIATGKVTLIGDAAHPMSPMGGSGGDTAIQDAADLASTLAEQGCLDSNVVAFEVRMAARAKAKIEHSFRGGEKFWRGKSWNLYSEVKI